MKLGTKVESTLLTAVLVGGVLLACKQGNKDEEAVEAPEDTPAETATVTPEPAPSPEPSASAEPSATAPARTVHTAPSTTAGTATSATPVDAGTTTTTDAAAGDAGKPRDAGILIRRTRPTELSR
ncbi:MAG: hypothetical protein JW751_20070 [Polyangiaceae bacterium]|nr:hypothetical protein [Polyangiaceae bacterium]